MPQAICPFLGTLDQQYNQGAPVDYPSFENRCLAANENEPLLLPDQATFCLGQGYRLCGRYQAAQRLANAQRESYPPANQSASERRTHARPPHLADPSHPTGRSRNEGVGSNTGGTRQPFNEPMLALDEAITDFSLSEEVVAEEEELRHERQRWAWIGAATVFVAVIFFGSLVALYVGWQWINSQLGDQFGRSRPLVAAPPPQAAIQPTIIFLTATPLPNQPAQQAANPAPQTQSNAAADQPAAVAQNPSGSVVNQPLSLPEAVTPTPGLINDPNQAQATDVPVVIVQPPAPPPLINVEIALPPTRRATPVLDTEIDALKELTATKLLTATLTLTPTNTPTPLGTPVVIFGPAATALPPGGCTILRWNVQNVKEVYYDFVGVNGQGESEECIENADGIFSLDVILGNGAKQTYTTTVKVILPTNTPAATFTYTPEPVFTPTWTPEPPTFTPTPNIRYGVALAVNGNVQQSCQAGALCTIGLLLTNSGEAIDNLSVHLLQGAWAPQLCRPDGVCGTNSLALVSVGPSNTAYIELRITVPAEASGQNASFQLNASSDNSGGIAVSDILALQIQVP